MEKRNLGGQGKGKGEGHDHCAAQERRRKQLASRSPIVAPITTGHPRAPFVNKYFLKKKQSLRRLCSCGGKTTL